MKSSPKFKIAAGVLGALAIAGVAAWVFQLINGLGVTGMSNGTSWGLYITMFMLFVGLSAGGLIVAASSAVMFPCRWHENCKKKSGASRPSFSPRCASAAQACSSSSASAAFSRVWRHHHGQPPTSPLWQDMCVITVPGHQHRVPGLHDPLRKSNRCRAKIAIVSRFRPFRRHSSSVTAWIFGFGTG